MTPNEQAIVDAFRDGYQGTLIDLALKLGIPSREVRAAVVPLAAVGIITQLPDGRFIWNGETRKKMAP